MDFNTLFSQFESKKVLIIGDAMIDAYMWGEINRTSPEAPVSVVEVKKHENRLGGAANVALNIQSLGAVPVLCSVIGNDNKGNEFQDLMKKSKLSREGIIQSNERKTTVKTRVISEGKHQLRIDEEDTFPITIENKLIALISKLINDANIIVFQDYNKGVLTNNIIKKTIRIANTKNIPTIVDPKTKNFNAYSGCDIFKPNLFEIKSGMNIKFNAENEKEIKEVTQELLSKIRAKGILLTLSERGICINSRKGFKHTPAFKKNIIDVSGAGDTVLSVAALCLACDINLIKLSEISCLAGGIVCEEIGVTPINKQQLLIEVKEHITL